ncbi:uncharacterized protein LOC143175498 [Nomia melanderi]|uniref:uncharacterized protein LOC143175498 n=1 Tax=Nomia melanderi TaxID=2448451 RepID=UPI003FCDCD6A
MTVGKRWTSKGVEWEGYMNNMEYFRSFLRVIGLLQPMNVDFISELPPEVSRLILKKLDAKSLLCAAQVSQRWLDVCGSDRTLRRTARHHKQYVDNRVKECFLGTAFSGSRTARRNKFFHIPQVQKIVPRVRIDANVVFQRFPQKRPSLTEGKHIFATVSLRILSLMEQSFFSFIIWCEGNFLHSAKRPKNMSISCYIFHYLYVQSGTKLCGLKMILFVNEF